MSIIDNALEANRAYAISYDRKLGRRPTPSSRVLGTTEILLFNQTSRGFPTFAVDEMNAKLRASTGDASPAMRLFPHEEPEENTREQIKKVRSHPWIVKEVPVRGFIFDVDTGRLSEVSI
jgi:carbonic anhydrase